MFFQDLCPQALIKLYASKPGTPGNGTVVFSFLVSSVTMGGKRAWMLSCKWARILSSEPRGLTSTSTLSGPWPGLRGVEDTFGVLVHPLKYRRYLALSMTPPFLLSMLADGNVMCGGADGASGVVSVGSRTLISLLGMASSGWWASNRHSEAPGRTLVPAKAPSVNAIQNTVNRGLLPHVSMWSPARKGGQHNSPAAVCPGGRCCHGMAPQ
mmetsp:Transcript_108991/g.307180  ORF Transcript_108991/g.307180 Transcript_108991/m.307180 type:complete len:211 (+) Transcript_108991:832-1464(+)